MYNGLQICTITAEMARKAKAVCQKKKAAWSTHLLDGAQYCKMDRMALQRIDTNIVEPKTT